MISAIALDDEPPALSVLEHFCARTDCIRLEKTFTGPQEALRYLRRFPVDLLFLDIQMPGISGLDFYKNLEVPTMVVFTTAFSEYAVEGFNVNAVDYLLKPFVWERFQQTVQKICDASQRQVKPDDPARGSLFLRADYRLVKITLDNIRYIESLDDYLTVHLKDGPPVTSRATLKAIAGKLPAAQFLRIHRSYIVAISEIVQFSKRSVTVGDMVLPVGDRYLDAFQGLFDLK